MDNQSQKLLRQQEGKAFPPVHVSAFWQHPPIFSMAAVRETGSAPTQTLPASTTPNIQRLTQSCLKVAFSCGNLPSQPPPAHMRRRDPWHSFSVTSDFLQLKR